MENTTKIRKPMPEDFKKALEEKKELIRKVRAGELDYLKGNVIKTI
ncbi:hypothetical protein VB264_22075 [Arcicella aquatica]|uniref:Uncharacterized protein n=1 Tax=Arcicella aquatica TaxID=217141 RepID=A0ABU5QTS7_9BACT|nr:hypothetical protein [Arcicella aquatica]MEA5260501.1 hypothetical protein [Arcicella aquatica]